MHTFNPHQRTLGSSCQRHFYYEHVIFKVFSEPQGPIDAFLILRYIRVRMGLIKTTCNRLVRLYWSSRFIRISFAVLQILFVTIIR